MINIGYIYKNEEVAKAWYDEIVSSIPEDTITGTCLWNESEKVILYGHIIIRFIDIAKNMNRRCLRFNEIYLEQGVLLSEEEHHRVLTWYSNWMEACDFRKFM